MINTNRAGNRKQNTEYRIQNTEYRIQNIGYRIQNAECRMREREKGIGEQKAEYRMQNAGNGQWAVDNGQFRKLIKILRDHGSLFTDVNRDNC